MITKAIHFFRRDLRIFDNDAFCNAVNNHDQVLPIFILDPYFKNSELLGTMRYRFLLESLIDLDIQLSSIGLKLTVYEGNSVEVITQLLTNNPNTGLTYNYDVQVEYGRIRDGEINQYCNNNNISLYIGNNQHTKIEDFVFDKWFEDHANYQSQALLIPKFSKQLDIVTNIKTVSIKTINTILNQLPKSKLFNGGSTQASTILNRFLFNDFDNYYWQLSRPYLAQNGHTSHLSAHIAFGTISTRQVEQQVKKYLNSKPNYKKKNMSGLGFIERLRWRDGFTNRLIFHPEIEWGNKFPQFDVHYNQSLTDTQKELLELWKNGNTGYPLIDAAMRQLKVDGWMIFRLRAMCASFLCFHLGVSWHHGAKHFMNYLVDGDIAINHWQWQMQAGATDPYNPIFRVYNPTKNIQERDPKLEYIHYWVPESRECKTYNELINQFPPILEYEDNMKSNKQIVSNIRKSIKNKFFGVQEVTIITKEDNNSSNQLF